MTLPESEIKTRTLALAANAFEAFCDDISGMFGIDMKCTNKGISTETTKELSQKYKKLAAVTAVKSEGILNGTFNVVFDQAGMFALAGIIIMLPKQKIIEDMKRGSTKDAEAIADTIKETGNLLVGSWDRVFREEMEGHGHFLQTQTYIGNPWDKPNEKIGVPETEQFQFVSFQMTVDDYPPFNCGVFFPESIFIPKPVEPEQPAAAAEPEKPEEKPLEHAETNSNPKADEAGIVEKPAEEKKEIVSSGIQTEQVKEEMKEPVLGPVSETIQKMIESSPQVNEGLSVLRLSAKDIMQTQVLFGSGDDSVQQALAKMQQAQTSYMLIGNNGVAEGIVSTYDLASAVSVYLKPAFAKWRRPEDDATLQIKVKWVMTKPIKTLKPDTSVAAVMEMMCQTGLRCMPVTSANGKIEGLITVYDILRTFLKNDITITSSNSLQPAASE